jgi:hypothetical protein
MFPGNYTNATTISNGATSPWTVNPPHQTGMLNGYCVVHAPSPSKRAGANRPGKWLYDMTPEERRALLARNGLVLSPQATSQGAQLQPGGILNPYAWGNWLFDKAAQYGVVQLAEAPAKEQVEPEKAATAKPAKKTEVSANARSGGYRSMDFFLKRIEGKFTCERLGKPCIAVPEETLRGMKVVIGNAHSEISEEWAEDLLMRFKRPGDKLIVEATSSELEDHVTRTAFCRGFSRENCIAGEVENLKDQLDAGLANLVELRFQRLSFLDPEEEFRIRVNHPLEETTRLMILINEAYVPRMRMLWPSLTAEQIETVRQLTEAIDSADEEFRLLMQQTMDARNQNYVRLLQGQMGNRETTTYVMVGERHVPGVMEAFSTTDTVLALYPVVRGEPRMTARRYV